MGVGGQKKDHLLIDSIDQVWIIVKIPNSHMNTPGGHAGTMDGDVDQARNIIGEIGTQLVQNIL